MTTKRQEVIELAKSLARTDIDALIRNIELSVATQLSGNAESETGLIVRVYVSLPFSTFEDAGDFSERLSERLKAVGFPPDANPSITKSDSNFVSALEFAFEKEELEGIRASQPEEKDEDD